MRPTTRYAKSGSVNIAYQTLGEGPLDLAWSIGLVSNIDLVWEEPHYADFLNRLADFSRVILWDRRGSGLSDRPPDSILPTLEERMEDLEAVLEAAGSEQAALFGFSEGSTLCALFAAAHPERVSSLVLWGTPIPLTEAGALSLFGGTAAAAEALDTFIAFMVEGWGTSQAVANFAPSMVNDPQFCDWFARNLRHSMSPGSVEAWIRSIEDVDLWDVLPSISAPTLVMCRKDDVIVPSGYSPLIAERIPGARYVELPGIDHFPFLEDPDSVVELVQEFLTGARVPVRPTRRLAVLLVTDLVGSTSLAATLGDQRWKELLSRHDDAVRTELAWHEGREVKTTGDGFLVEFDGPARAIHCALALADSIEPLGLEVRMGVHAGECDLLGDDLGGIAVHVATHVATSAEPGEILASGTVRDLVAGSGISFDEPRTVELGLDEKRNVYPVMRRGASPTQVRRALSGSENVFRKEGDYWTAAFAGKVVLLKDSKGVQDIAQLLRRGGAEIHVLDLMVPREPKESALSAGLEPSSGHTAEPVIDDQARAQFLSRIRELSEELEEAETEGNQERAARARVEIEFIEGELGAAYGLRGRARMMTDPAERARKAITRRIKESIDRIEREHRALGNHLRHSIKTGTFCSYSPESDASWSI
jgi:pimeloyl-ACP methyl ester carboxylesterase